MSDSSSTFTRVRLERARIAVRLLLVELLDETVPAGELCRIARSVQQTLHEHEGGYEGADEDVHPTKSPQRELAAFADAVVQLLFSPASQAEWGDYVAECDECHQRAPVREVTIDGATACVCEGCKP